MQRLVLFSVVFLSILWSAPVTAQPTTTKSSSILFFPNLVADETRDSVVQITNVSNSAVFVRCFYLSFVSMETDFSIFLFGLQPTQWVLSRGRTVDPDDDCLSDGGVLGDCSGAGSDPGPVHPVPLGFRGQLICIETDQSGAPFAGNHLRGQVAIVDRFSAGVSRYAAIGIGGTDFADGGDVLVLGGGMEEEYAACPESWILNHPTDVAENGTLRRTCVTVIPCSLDLQSMRFETVPLEFIVTNDLEQTFAAITTITSWEEVCLSDLDDRFLAEVSGARHVQTRIRSAEESSGIALVAETLLSSDGQERQTSSAVNLHSEGVRTKPDVIVLP
jgi:hypothetical protein